MDQKKYWKGLEELNNTPEYKKHVDNEFQEELPFNESENFMSIPTPRRDFLKYVGFSVTAATVAASCEIKVRKAIPYAIKPEEITPGVPNYYSSTFVEGGDYCPVTIKTIDGRPIKIEGNEMSSITGGGTSARVQASVLSLYDVARLKYPTINGKEITWAAIDKEVKSGLSSAGGKKIAILSSSIVSPSVKQSIADFSAKYPSTEHVVYDPVSYSGLLLANEACYGKRAIPSYRLDKAQFIVGINADFLGTWLSPVEFAYQYSQNRKINEKNPKMSRHIQFEPNITLTGSNADYRYSHKPSEEAAIITALYNAVASAKGQSTVAAAPEAKSKRVKEGIDRAAKGLVANQGKALVVCGSNDPNVQVLVNGINEMISAGGNTIDWNTTVNYRQGIDQDLEQLIAEMNAGTVGAVLVYGSNPAYDFHNADAFVKGLKKVPLTVSFNDRKDETTTLCKYVAPDSHYLESWGDAEPKTGYYSLQQPGIAPLFKTRQFIETMLVWSGASETDPIAYIKNNFKNNIYAKYGNGGDFVTYWEQTLQNGVAEPATAPAMGTAAFAGNATEAATRLVGGAAKGSDLEVVFYETVALRSGKDANNPWLQELPDPITRCTWDNYVCISPALSIKLDVPVNRFNEMEHTRPVLKVTLNGKNFNLPVIVVPGLHPEVVAIALGYGRANSIGRAGGGVGTNIFPFVAYNAKTKTWDYHSTDIKLADSGKTHDLGITQMHNSYEGRPIIQETSLKQFQDDPEIIKKEHEMEAENTSLYPDLYHYDAIHWGMAIDLNSCIGCGACSIACTAENNVSVVGRKEVVNAHEMQWLRIDRYFSGDPENPQVVFQPMLCQQCDNAPCENVCPVAATNHSNEGINQMIYNRCIGTRYCENNCPYKVRRFNWRDWNGADSFEGNLYEDPVVEDMNENLTRMVLNPEVTVRSRGVMEKCSFCQQRLQAGKLVAKKEGRPLKDGDVKTACQQACPTNAIEFGNFADKKSKVYKIKHEEQPMRSYYVLDELHTLPSINYLAKIRNKDPEDFYLEPLMHTF